MKKFDFDLILHPVRMRIILALTGSRRTSQELAEILNDVPQATLYRHINRLAQAGIIQVVEERPVRGTVEKVYAVDPQAGRLSEAEFAGLSKDEHMRYFVAFVTTLIGDFERYLENCPQIDFATDGVGYHKLPLELSDEEFGELAKALNEVLLPALQNLPAPGRRRRLLTTILMPDKDVPQAMQQPVARAEAQHNAQALTPNNE